MGKVFSKHFWTDGPGSFVVAVLIALTIRWAFVEAYVIPSPSMLPTLLIHDHIFVNKFVYGLRVPFTDHWMAHFESPKRGDVVVFRYPDNPSIFYIKRVIGVPGDKIYFENGNLYVNDNLVKNDIPDGERIRDFAWLRNSDFLVDGQGGISNYNEYEETLGHRTFPVLLKKDGEESVFGPVIVPPNSYFMMGDNRDNSNDSRFWKHTFVPRDYLVGRAMFVWLSCRKDFSVIPICDPATIRWRRFFHEVIE